MTKNKKEDLKGFKTLWIKFDEETTDKHQLFIKEHSIRNQASDHPRGRTLFVLNIPPYVSLETLHKVFSNSFGTVSNVYFTRENPKGFKTAYIVFTNESTLEEILESANNYVITLNTETNTCLTGLAKWCIEYNNSISDESKMKEEITVYMENYDKEIADEIAREKAMKEEEEKADGWVTVTGRKKRGQFALSRKESVINKVKHEEEKKTKKKQLLNFYTFQIKESRRQELAELRKKFDLDKQRIEDIKSKRTFKPF